MWWLTDSITFSHANDSYPKVFHNHFLKLYDKSKINSHHFIETEETQLNTFKFLLFMNSWKITYISTMFLPSDRNVKAWYSKYLTPLLSILTFWLKPFVWSKAFRSHVSCIVLHFTLCHAAPTLCVNEKCKTLKKWNRSCLSGEFFFLSMYLSLF